MKVITDLNPQKFILSVNNPQSENLKVSVEGIGGIVYRTQINVSFSKRFDMSGIEDGEYTVIVYNGKTTYRKTVLLNTKDDMSRSLAVN